MRSARQQKAYKDMSLEAAIAFIALAVSCVGGVVMAIIGLRQVAAASSALPNGTGVMRAVLADGAQARRQLWARVDDLEQRLIKAEGCWEQLTSMEARLEECEKRNAL